MRLPGNWHVGSNPTISARTGEVTPIGVTSPVFLLEKSGIRTREGFALPVALGREPCARRFAPPQLAEQPVAAHAQLPVESHHLRQLLNGRRKKSVFTGGSGFPISRPKG